MDNLITTIIGDLVNINIENDIFRTSLILIISIFIGVKVYSFQNSHTFKLKTKKYEYIRKMFFDSKNDKRSFFFSVQEYLGIALEEKEVEYLTKNNFYFFSRHLKQAYKKIIFKDDGYQLKYPIIGALWAIIFYVLTFVPIVFYLFHIMDIRKSLSYDSFISINTTVLPIFIFLSIISFYNLNILGSARGICNYKKRLPAHDRIPPAPAKLTTVRGFPQGQTR